MQVGRTPASSDRVVFPVCLKDVGALNRQVFTLLVLVLLATTSTSGGFPRHNGRTEATASAQPRATPDEAPSAPAVTRLAEPERTTTSSL